MPSSAHRQVFFKLIWAMVLILLGTLLMLFAHRPGLPPTLTIQILAAAGWLVALLLLFQSMLLVRDLGRGLDWVRTSLLNVVAGAQTQISTPESGFKAPEITTLLLALERFQGQSIQDREAPNQRLLAVLSAINSGVVVTTESGQVSLINGLSQDLLGAERARVGTSLFASLSRESVVGGLEKAQKMGRPIEAVFERLDGVDLQGRISPLPDQEGAIIIFPSLELDRHRPEVDFDLTLHDIPPADGELSLETPLDDLPLLIMDTETTGLNAAEDRIVSFGAVCAHGTRLYRGHMMDDLVNPGVPIPAASTKIHGITDSMVQGARPWPELHAEYQALSRNRVVVGHSLPFDLTIMKAECERHQRPWQHPVFIDTLRLASLLNPTLRSFDLEDLASLYQIDLHGRHTALGDALVCAELFSRMVPRLQMQGFNTLEQLLRFHCNDAVEVIALQKQAGWITDQPDSLRSQGEGH